jgi:hypothetical protein
MTNFQVKKAYEANIMECGISETKSGKPQAYVTFSVKADDGSYHRYTWYGNLGEKSQEFTASQLVKVGFMGNSFDDLKKGTTMFDLTKPRTVEFGYMQTQNTITGEYEDITDKLKIKWMNLKSSGVRNFDANTGINNQAALFEKVKSELGVKKNKTSTKPVPKDW